MSNRAEVVRGFISKIRAIDIESSAMKIQMSKKMTKSSDLRSVRARRVLIKGKPLVSVVYRHDTRDVTKNYTHIDFVVLCSEWMESQFFNATLTLDVVEHKLLSNKK